jgi:hypothetical protein
MEVKVTPEDGQDPSDTQSHFTQTLNNTLQETSISPNITISTILDSDEEDAAVPVADWGDINPILQSEDGNEEDSEEEIEQNTLPETVVVSAVRWTKKSLNRDDSDSEDEDEVNINKSDAKAAEYIIDANFNPFNDDESILNGFKVGFSEDRNKKYRRTMEVFI